jgi:hypothetical protein
MKYSRQFRLVLLAKVCLKQIASGRALGIEHGMAIGSRLI